MLGLVSTILRINRLDKGHYAEPYAGGSGLALKLLVGGYVADIHINDIDPTIWAFWHCVLNETDDLINKIRSTPVNIENWLEQKEFLRSNKIDDVLALGFCTFFLNRTNRSGVIKGGGVIGGKNQTGNYKIDCRYNTDNLILKIRRIKKYSSQIHLTNLDAIEFMEQCDSRLPKNTFIFSDPPYYNKGSTLYTSYYNPEDHKHVAQSMLASNFPWIVTYDDTPEIRNLYQEKRQFCFDINYSLHEKRLGTELLIASNGLIMPEHTRERQLNRSQYSPEKQRSARSTQKACTPKT